MGKSAKTLFLLTGILAVLLLAINYLAPKFINSEGLKSSIERAASESVGGTVVFEKIDLSLFPVPRASIIKGRMSSETAAGTLDSISVYPRILPLFMGDFRATKILIESPKISIPLPEQKSEKKEQAPVTAETIKGMLASLASEYPGLTVVLNEGSINLTDGKVSLYSLEDFDLRITLPRKGPETITAGIKSPGAKLTFQKEGKDIVVDLSGIDGSFYFDKDRTSITLNDLVINYPKLNLKSQLTIDNNSGAVSLFLEGRKVDVYKLREAVLALAGDIPVTQTIFEIVKGGNIPLFTFKSHGSSFAGLGKLENMAIAGRMSEGKIVVPGVQLDLEAVSGDIAITKGVLEGKGIQARLENTYAREGVLRIGLDGEDAPFHMETDLQADLSDLPIILEQLVKSETFSEELSKIENLKGKASGRLVLGESLNSINAQIEISDLDLAANYRELPFPIEISAGYVSYDEKGVKLKELNGKAGQMTINDVSLQADLLKGQVFALLSGSASIDLDEAYPLLSDHVDLPDMTMLRSPLNIEQMNMVWDRTAGESMKGGLTLGNGLNLLFDVAASEGELKIHRVTVRDNESDATAAVTVKESEIFTKFKGNITQGTVEKILKAKGELKGEMEGDFYALIMKDQPNQFAASGRLAVKDIALPTKLEGPVVINEVLLEAGSNRIRLVNSDVTLDESQLNLKGYVRASNDSFIIDMDFTAGELDWNKLKKAFVGDNDNRDDKENEEDKGPESSYDYPVRGVIRFDAESVTYDDYTSTPLKADIAIEPDTIKVKVIKADVCGISFPGKLGIADKEISLDFSPSALYKDLEFTVSCLKDAGRHITGRYKLDMHVTADGQSDRIIELLNGNITFNARDGRIYKGGVLAKILAFINITEIFRGRLPDLVNEGFAYKSLSAVGQIQGGKLTLSEMILDASSMKIIGSGDIFIKEKKLDLDLNVAPLKTVDFVMENVPLFKKITGGTLVSIPLKVKGDIGDPEVEYQLNR